MDLTENEITALAIAVLSKQHLQILMRKQNPNVPSQDSLDSIAIRYDIPIAPYRGTIPICTSPISLTEHKVASIREFLKQHGATVGVLDERRLSINLRRQYLRQSRGRVPNSFELGA